MSLTEMRKKLGMRQHEVSDMIGITQVHYSGIERGIRRPSPQVAEKIAKIFGMSVPEMWQVFYDRKGGNECQQQNRNTTP